MYISKEELRPFFAFNTRSMCIYTLSQNCSQALSKKWVFNYLVYLVIVLSVCLLWCVELQYGADRYGLTPNTVHAAFLIQFWVRTLRDCWHWSNWWYFFVLLNIFFSFVYKIILWTFRNFVTYFLWCLYYFIIFSAAFMFDLTCAFVHANSLRCKAFLNVCIVI